jgi:ABC-type antimicrobial peptide transport system permease subunit
MRVGLGDSVEVSGQRAAISGLTTGTNILATQFIFADFDAVAAGTNSIGQASFILVRLGRESDRESVVAAVERAFPELRAYPRDDFVKSNEREVTAGFVPLMTLVMLLGAGAAALLVGLLLLAIVDERRGEIAVLMAMGTGWSAVARGILARTTLISLEGALAGVLLSLFLEAALKIGLPTIPLRIAPADIAAVVLLFMATGLAAAAGPVVRLNAIDPLEAFRS